MTILRRITSFFRVRRQLLDSGMVGLLVFDSLDRGGSIAEANFRCCICSFPGHVL